MLRAISPAINRRRVRRVIAQGHSIRVIPVSTPVGPTRGRLPHWSDHVPTAAEAAPLKKSVRYPADAPPIPPGPTRHTGPLQNRKGGPPACAGRPERWVEPPGSSFLQRGLPATRPPPRRR